MSALPSGYRYLCTSPDTPATGGLRAWVRVRSARCVGVSASGNPTFDVVLVATDGSTHHVRTSLDAGVAYGIENPELSERHGTAWFYAILTRAGRLARLEEVAR